MATSTTRSFSYQWWDSAKQTELRVQANGGPQGWAPGVSKLSYDVNGNLYRATDVTGQRTTQYVTDGDGQILYRQEIAARAGVAGDWNATTLEAVAGVAERKRNYYYLNGHRIGDVNNENGAPSTTDYATALAQAKNISNDERNTRFAPTAYANFDENYQPINDAYPGAAPTDYTVAEGDTLNSIAARIWGDRAMWYLIADANGLSGSEKLSAGTRLVIPNKVANIHNNSGTFKVYDAGEAIGDVSPTLPPPPPPPNKGCGGLGQIIMVVIAVVVTIYTAGAAAGLMGATGGAWSAGLAVMGGTSGIGVAGALGAAAVGGAAGSIASQGFAMATGMQDEFSWKAVGQSALGGAITAGVGSAANNVGMLSALKDTGSAWAQAGRAALGSSVNQALHGNWNWQAVTASALGAGVGTALGGALGGSELGKQIGSFGTQVISGFVGGVTAQWAGPGGRANYGSAFAGAMGGVLGSALGDAVVGSIAKGDGVKASAQQQSKAASSLSPEVAAKADEFIRKNPAYANDYQMVVDHFSGKSSGAGGDVSFFKNPSIVESGINGDGNRFDRYDTSAVATAVKPQPEIEAHYLPPMEAEGGILSDLRTGVNSYWGQVSDDGASQKSFFKYAAGNGMRTLGNLGLNVADFAVDAWNSPDQVGIGAIKFIPNAGPEAFNAAVNALKTSANGYSLAFEAAGMGNFDGFRSTKPYNITPLVEYDNRAQAGGAFLAGLATGVAASKYGGYSFEIDAGGPGTLSSNPFPIKLTQAGEPTAPVFNPAGAARAAQYNASQQGVSLQGTIANVVGDNPTVTYTASGKTIYGNSTTGMQVVHDNAGNYFRVENTNVTGPLRYADQFGKPIPANVPLIKQTGITQTGVPSDVRNALTHFTNTD